MTFCCGAFQANFEMAGHRGFSVFAVALEKDKAAFIVQHRAMENFESPPDMGAPVSLISEMYIHCCPWCGTRLQQFYGANSGLLRPDLKLG